MKGQEHPDSRATRFRGNAAHRGETEKSWCCATERLWQPDPRFQAALWVGWLQRVNLMDLKRARTFGHSMFFLEFSNAICGVHNMSSFLRQYHRITTVALWSCHQGLVVPNFLPRPHIQRDGCRHVHKLWNVYLRLKTKRWLAHCAVTPEAIADVDFVDVPIGLKVVS